VADGVSEGRISSRAEEEIRKGLDHALERFAEGDTERAIEELAHLEEEVDHLVDHDEIHQSEEHRIDAAIEDLARQMLLASPPEDD
jgi:plasmid stabilization system protein ParE